MSVYVSNKYHRKLPSGAVACSLSADSEKELHKFAEKLEIPKDMFCEIESGGFYFISKSKMKLAVNLGALTGEEAEQTIRIKKDLILKGLIK